MKRRDQFSGDYDLKTMTSLLESMGFETCTQLAVGSNRAKQELAMLKAKDPLPLDRAKINQGAAVRKVKKARKKAEKTATASKEEYAKANEAFKKAETDLAVIAKQTKGAGQGTLWFMQRELAEAKKYMTPKQLKKSDEELMKKMGGF